VLNPANGKVLRVTVADRGRAMLAADLGDAAPAERESR
jgi:hypothetical protein